MTFKNIKLKNLCYLFLIFKEVDSINEKSDKNKLLKNTNKGSNSEQVNFVLTHTIIFIQYNVYLRTIIFYLVVLQNRSTKGSICFKFKTTSNI